MAEPTDKPLTEHPLDALLPLVYQYMNEWHQQKSPDVLRRNIHAALDKSSREVLLKLMGFNNGWGGAWEIDHCNGRSGNSIAGEFLKKTQKEALEAWLKAVTLPTLTPKQEADILESMTKEYLSNFRSQIRKVAREKAQQDVQALVERITPAQTIDSFGQLLELLQPKDT